MMASWIVIAGTAVLAGLGVASRFTFWRPNVDGVPVLMYHYLTDDLAGTKLAKMRVRPAAFARQVDYLADRGYRTISLDEYCRHRTEGRSLPDRPVLITFDDGARDCLLTARDVLARRNMTAVVFPVTDCVGGTNAWDRSKAEPVVPLLDWDGVRELVASGWEVGSHTRTHPDLTALNDDELADELAGSKTVLEKETGREVIALSYPYGRTDARVRAAAKAAGYRLAWNIRAGKNTPADDPLDLKRIIIKRKDTLLDLSLKLKKGRSTL